MDKLLKYIKPLRQRIYANSLISAVSAALTLSFAADAVLVLYTKFVYMYGWRSLLIALPVPIIATALVICQFMYPSEKKTIRIADSLGFKERFVTAAELSQKQDRTPIEQLVVDDALQNAKTADFKALYPIKVNKKQVIIPLAAFVAFAVIYLLPIPPSEKMQAQEEMHEMLDETVENMQQKVKSGELKLTDAQKGSINKEIKKIKKELSKANTKQQAVDTLTRGQNKLKKISQSAQNEQIQAIGSRLAQNKSTQTLGELLKSGNIEDFKSELSAVNDKLDNMTAEQVKELGKAFKDAAAEKNINEETKQLLNELGNTLNGELTDEQKAALESELNRLSDNIDKLSKQNKDIRDAVDKLNNELADAGRELGGNTQPNGQQQNTQQPNGQNSNCQSPNGQDPNGQNPNGQNSNGQDPNGQSPDGQAPNGQDPNGQTGGQQQGGQGNVSGGQTGRSGQAQNGAPSANGAGTGTIPNANVYSAKAKNYGSYSAELDENNPGQKTGEKTKTTVDGETGEIVPYTDVYSQYKDEAMNDLEKEDIPYGVKDIVKDYFSAIE